MKKTFSILITMLLISKAFAQVPEKMSYQAVIRNSSNQLAANKEIGLRISILQGSESGTAVYVETQIATSNANGLVSIEIGAGSPVSGTLSDIDWSAGSYFIKTETAIEPPLTNYTIIGTSKILSVPYALYSKTSGNFTLGLSTGDMLYWNGAKWTLIPHGNPGQILSVGASNIPEWQNPTIAVLKPPYATTDRVENIDPFSATLIGTINPNGLTTEVFVQIGKTTEYEMGGGYEHDGETQFINGDNNSNVSFSFPNLDNAKFDLEPFTTYHCRIVAKNAAGTTYGENRTFTTLPLPLEIGQNYQGGKVAYILHPRDPGYVHGETHGLVVSLNDLSSGIQWNNGSNILTGANGEFIGTGSSNTDKITSAQGSGSYAAILCKDYSFGGYSDWYLPSGIELCRILQNGSTIGGFSSGFFWSSTEYDEDFAMACAIFEDVSYGTANKSENYKVRAVHSF